ncbi:MAG: carbohydrate kinase family protein [Melioribacteraceae bacterium]|nr:carbohydrate kinase family protein [Melioribacteraceae bacterium]
MKSLNIDKSNLRYKTMIGVGAVGTGTFFKLSGSHTLGREESRSGHYLGQKDYCKLHIIAHYVKTLAGAEFKVTPISKVGEDDAGSKLIEEMSEAGLELNFMKQSKDSSTLYAFCFVYPDGSGGNLFTSDSASSQVDTKSVANAEPEFARFKNEGVALAAPEVSMEARMKLLELATENNYFRAASFLSEEIFSACESDILNSVDLLSINLDEAAAAVELQIDENSAANIVETAIKKFRSKNKNILVSITNGRNGSWIWDGDSITNLPSCKVKVMTTAGAGDAFLSGLIVGLTAGLSLKEAQQLGTLAGGVAVTSPNAINKNLDKNTINKLAEQSNHLQISENVQNLIKE